MENSFLKSKIKDLQQDYSIVLKSALSRISTRDFPMVIDEINVFWFANRDLVRLILQNVSVEYDCYTFTGATFLDIDDLEHYPFVSLGKTHIVDDPLYKYTQTVSGIRKEDLAEQIKKQILLSISDNIKIIEKYSDIIYILPVTLLSDINSDLVKSATEQTFFSMFKDKEITHKQYIENFKTIEDVENALEDGAREIIVFSDDNEGNDLISRFKSFTAQMPPFSDKINEAMNFFYLINGFLAQSISILLMCAEYRMIPYLRFGVTFRYTILLGSNFADNKEMQTILFKSICAHLLYIAFDKSKIKEIDFIDYLTILQKENFNDNVFRALEKNKVDFYKPSFTEISGVLHNELNKVFELLSKSNS